MRRLIAPLIVAPILCCGVPGFAQNNPSTEQIMNDLKPTGALQNDSTRGIRLAPPPATAAPSGVAPHVKAAAAKPMAAAPSVSLGVDFATGSAKLTPQAMAMLDSLGRALSSTQLAGYRFRIEGHTDTVGSAAYNQALSQQRAQAVAAYLAAKFNIAASRLEAIGVGEQGLLVPTPPQTPEPRNRRVQVINLGA
jgi:OmpA-OmpF porin, OOP family